MATRIGLKYTTEEVTDWRSKWISGPYKTKGDVAGKPNSPGDGDRIKTVANEFKSNPNGHNYTTYWTGANPWPQVVAGTFDPKNGHVGYELQCCAFAYLMEEVANPTLAATYAIPVIARIRDMMYGTGYALYDGKPAFNWADTARFNGAWADVNPGFTNAEWFERHIYAFEYTQSYTYHATLRPLGWTTADITRFKSCCKDFANLMWRCNDGALNGLFQNRANKDYRASNAVIADQTSGANKSLLYYGGPSNRKIERFYSNRRTAMVTCAGIIGVFIGDQALINKSKTYCEEMYMFSVWPTGVYCDAFRNMDKNPLTGFSYSAFGSVYNFCDVLARIGDFGSSTSFGYNYSTTKGTLAAAITGVNYPVSGSTDCSSDGVTPKGPKLTATFLSNARVHQPPLYYVTAQADRANPANAESRVWRVSGYNHSNGQHNVNHCILLLPGKFFGGTFGARLTAIAKAEYGTLNNGDSTAIGSVPWPSSPESSGPVPGFSVPNNVGTMFQYDNNINPYPNNNLQSQTITFPLINSGSNGVYGSTYSLAATTTSGLPISYTIDTVISTGTGTISGTTLTSTSAGTIFVIANQGGNSVYSAATSVSRSIIIAKKALTVTIDNATRVYNKTEPVFSAVYTGFVGSDTIAAIDTKPTFSTVASISSDAGTYAINGTGGLDNNYTFVFVAGVLTITKGKLTPTFTVVAEFNKISTDIPYQLTGVLYEEGTTTIVTGVPVVFTKESGTSVSTISSTGLVTLSGTTGISSVKFAVAANPNYFQYVTIKDISVTVAPLISQTITFNALSAVTYGATSGVLSATGGTSGNPVTFKSSDVSIATCTGTNGTTITYLKAGIVNIIASQAGNNLYASAPDVIRQLTINKKILTVTTVASTKVYNTQNPVFTYVISGGYVGSDTVANITTLPIPTTSAVQNSNAGTYAVLFSGAFANNYTFTYVAANLTITKANQVITFNSIADKLKNDAPFLLVGNSTSGLTITYTKNSGPFTISTATVTLSGTVGTGSITASQAGNTNYNAATSVINTFAINNATPLSQIIIPVEISNKVYGDSDFVVDANTASNLSITVEIVSGNEFGELDGSIAPATCTILGAGTIKFKYSQAGNADYLPAIDTYLDVIVNKAEQTITSPTIVDKFISEDSFTATGSASSGLALTYTSENSILSQTVVGSATFNIDSIGAGLIKIVQAGNTNYKSIETTRVVNVIPDIVDSIVDVLDSYNPDDIVYTSAQYLDTLRFEFFAEYSGLGTYLVDRIVLTCKDLNPIQRIKVQIFDGVDYQTALAYVTNDQIIIDASFVSKTLNNKILVSSVGSSLRTKLIKTEVFGIAN